MSMCHRIFHLIITREDRTDVMILDKPVAVSDEPNTGREYETIVILEIEEAYEK